MTELKQLCQQLGITLGCGPVDPYGPYPPLSFPDSGSFANGDPCAEIIKGNFGQLDLSAYAGQNASGPDWSHYGSLMRWSSPTTFDFSGMDATASFARANGMRISIPNPEYFNETAATYENDYTGDAGNVPAWLYTGVHNGTYSRSQVSDMLLWLLNAVYGRYQDAYVTTACNEIFGNFGWTYFMYDHASIFTGFTKIQIVDYVYRFIRSVNPNIKIIYNQTGGISRSVLDTYIKPLLDMGTPIDGIGEQGHNSSDAFDPSIWVDQIAYARSLGLEVHFTEVDASDNPVDLYGSYYRRYKTLISAGVKDISTWGTRNPDFVGNPTLMFNADLTPSPAYTGVLQALREAANVSPKIAHRLRSPSGGKIRGKGGIGKVTGKPQ